MIDSIIIEYKPLSQKRRQSNKNGAQEDIKTLNENSIESMIESMNACVSQTDQLIDEKHKNSLLMT
jgi:hypothetical protein